MTWRLVWTRSAAHDLRQLDPQVARRVRSALLRLAEEGHGDIRRLTGYTPPAWRPRVGDWRVLFRFEQEATRIDVLRVLHRREAYRD